MNFIKRNTPVIIIGIITLFVFIGIIAISQKNPPQGANLQEVDTQKLVSAHSYIRGDIGAPIEIVEFGDFECPACASYAPIVNRVIENNQPYVNLSFKHFPLPQHTFARMASEAAQIAGEYGKFWEYADVLYANQSQLDKESLINWAEKVGINRDEFKQKLESGDYSAPIIQDMKLASELGVNSTPTFYLNGKKMTARNPSDFEAQVKDAVNELRESNPNLPAPVGNGNEGNQASPISQGEEEKPAVEYTEAEIDSMLGGVNISFTNEGFIPRNTTAYKYQLVTIKNDTDKTFTWEQPNLQYPDLGREKTLEPGQSFQMRLTKEKLWNYRNKDNILDYGSIFVYPHDYLEDK